MAAPAWQRLFRTSNDLTLTVARLMLALVFLGHGSQKMFGWFEGPGLKGFGGAMASMHSP